MSKLISKQNDQYTFIRNRESSSKNYQSVFIKEENIKEEENNFDVDFNSTQDNLNINPIATTYADNLQLTSNSVLRLLNSNFRGKLVLAYYESKTGVLESELSSIIIENEFENSLDCKIKKERFLKLRDEIKEIFPTELPEAWFSPLTRSINGEVINPRGKLYNKYNEKRRILNEINYMNKGLKRKQNVNKDTVTETLYDEDVLDSLDFLKNNIEPENRIINAWMATTQARLNLKKSGINDYYNTFKCLQGNLGITLLLKDFDLIYKENSENFLQNWSTVAKNIINVSKKRGKSRQYVELNEMLEKNKRLINEGNIELVALILLPYLLGSSYRKRKKDSIWTPSKQDVLDSFILHIETYEELILYQERKRKIYLEENINFQPYPVLCGSLDKIHSSFVIINDVEYLIDTPLKAIDICFKAFFALNTNYPLESKGCWVFLQKFVFNIPIEREDSAVNKLITQLQ
ncbi:uncharacterized protein LOC127286345 [Leptopilina boulardi]|uniref:uncharacterized protein LOC127286345 n=1 Tax=Leptopilina boulardi TaxID=63433 RepID=UPI0021F51E0A|nr:uncharacterized protein LOC127286345 [Leptopilina boulardi]